MDRRLNMMYMLDLLFALMLLDLERLVDILYDKVRRTGSADVFNVVADMALSVEVLENLLDPLC